MTIKTLAAAGIVLLSTGFAASAATVPGLSAVTDNGGGSYTFTFDTVGADIDGTGMGLSFTNGTGLSFVATGTGLSAAGGTETRIVRQDHPADGGLGILGSPFGDNMGLGEVLTLTFNGMVDILGFTFNDGHTDAATGDVDIITSTFTGTAPANLWDGVGTEHVNQGMLCSASLSFCGQTYISFAPTGNNAFSGYLESITIQVSQVPLPAGSLLLLSGLGGLTVLRRRRKS